MKEDWESTAAWFLGVLGCALALAGIAAAVQTWQAWEDIDGGTALRTQTVLPALMLVALGLITAGLGALIAQNSR